MEKKKKLVKYKGGIHVARQMEESGNSGHRTGDDLWNRSWNMSFLYVAGFVGKVNCVVPAAAAGNMGNDDNNVYGLLGT